MCCADVKSTPRRPPLELIDPNLPHAALNTGVPQIQDSECVGPSSSKRPQKDRAANELVPETLVFIEAKRKQYDIKKKTLDK